MKKILSLSNPQEVLSPRDELRMMLDSLASEGAGIPKTWAERTASVAHLKDMPFFQKTYSSQESMEFSQDESRKLLAHLRAPRVNPPCPMQDSTQELANKIARLRYESPNAFGCKVLLRDVLTAIVSQVSDKITKVLLSETLKDVFSQFRDKCLDVILDVLDTSGRNTTDLMALYVEVKIDAINYIKFKSPKVVLLDAINRDIATFVVQEPVSIVSLFTQLDTVLTDWVGDMVLTDWVGLLNQLEPTEKKEFISSISQTFITRFETEPNVFGANGINSFEPDTSSPSVSLQNVLDLVLNGDLEITGKNKTLVIPMYIEARLKAIEVKNEKTRLAREAERAEEQRLRNLEFASLNELHLKVLEEKSALKQNRNEAPIDYAARVPYRYEDVIESIRTQVSTNFLNTYVRKCGDPQLTQEYVDRAVGLIVDRLFVTSRDDLFIFQTPRRRKNALNQLLRSLELDVNRPSRALIKSAVPLVSTKTSIFRIFLGEVIRETLIKGARQISREFTLEEALDAVGKLDILNEPNPNHVHLLIRAALGSIGNDTPFNLTISEGRVCSNDRVSFVYGELNSRGLTTIDFEHQKCSNNVLIGFVLKTVKLSDIPYYRYEVTSVMEYALNSLSRRR